MYQFWVFVHLVGVFGFLAAHGVSIAITFRLRKERDPRRVNDLIAFSGTTIRAFYISLAVLLIGGTVAGVIDKWWYQGWIWAALIILIATSVTMVLLARPYYRRAAFVARVVEPRPFEEVVGPKGTLTVVLDPGAPGRLSACLPEDATAVRLMVGPEGGFAQDELDLARDAGAVSASLGEQILRTETAAVVGASLVLHRYGRLG